MKEKIFEPARHNEASPAPGMAAVNTFMPEEAPLEELIKERTQKEKDDVGHEKERSGDTRKE